MKQGDARRFFYLLVQETGIDAEEMRRLVNKCLGDAGIATQRKRGICELCGKPITLETEFDADWGDDPEMKKREATSFFNWRLDNDPTSRLRRFANKSPFETYCILFKLSVVVRRYHSRCRSVMLSITSKESADVAKCLGFMKNMVDTPR